MTESPRPNNPEAVGLNAGIIVGALMTGVVLMAGVAVFAFKGQPAQSPMLALIGVGVGAIAIAARFIVPTIVVNGGKARLKQAEAAERRPLLAGLYLTKTIIGGALLEGAALFNLVAYIVERQPWSCVVAAVLVGVMAVTFPSQAQFESWADDMRRELPR